MKRRNFLKSGCGALLGRARGADGAHPGVESYFPDAAHQFVWRNWDLVSAARMARLLKVDTAAVEGIGRSMGLVKPTEPLEKYERRNRLAILRRNWDYLPNEQLCLLLGMTAEELRSFLLYEVAYWAIVGPKQPCKELVYSARRPDDPRVTFIRQTVERYFGKAPGAGGEERFAFIEALSRPGYERLRAPEARPRPDEHDLSSGWELVLPEGGVPVKSVISEPPG